MKKLFNNYETIMADPKITSTAKLVLVMLMTKPLDKGTVQVRDEELAMAIGRGPREVYRSYGELGITASKVMNRMRKLSLTTK